MPVATAIVFSGISAIEWSKECCAHQSVSAILQIIQPSKTNVLSSGASRSKLLTENGFRDGEGVDTPEILGRLEQLGTTDAIRKISFGINQANIVFPEVSR